VLIVASVFKKIDAGKILLIFWAVLMFVATASQVRFAAYLAVVFALLAGYFYSEAIVGSAIYSTGCWKT